jgi:lactate permease
VTLAAALAAGSRWVGVDVAGILGGLIVTALMMIGSRGGGAKEITEPRPRGLALARTLAPSGILVAALLATRLIPPLRAALQAVLVLDLPVFRFRLPLVYHSGFWLVVTALVSAPILGVTGRPLFLAVRTALRQWASVSLAVASFLCFSSVMYAAGMTGALAQAVAEATGPVYVVLLPAIGALGGFLTASGSGSNAMFAQFLVAVATRLHLPVDVVVSAHNVASANFTLACPPRLILGAAVAGITGQEGLLMRPALAVAMAGLAGTTAMLWLWIGG